MSHHPKPRNRGLFFLVLVSFSLFAFILSTLVTARVLRRESEVMVPDLTNKSYESARSILRVQRLPIAVAEYRFDRQIPVNQIISQDPPAGQTVKSGRQVRVVVSRGTSASKVPELNGMNMHQAAIELAKLGLNVGRVSRFYSPDADKDIVLDQSPRPGDYTNRGTNINLLVSQGAKPIWYIMPSLKGLSIDRATQVLNYIQVELKEIKRIVDDLQPSGTVMEQIPVAGMRIQAGDPAGLIASIQTADQQQGPRLVNILYHVPPSQNEVRVKLIIRDNTGLHEIYNAMEKPDSEIKIQKTIQGDRAKMYIYINNAMTEERDI
jgi:serine/threonine-protein kinase